MTAGDAVSDPRPQLALALDQVERLIEVLEPEELERPTPCADYDVRMLIAHLVAVLRKLTVARNGGDVARVMDPVGDLAGEEAEAFRHARAALEKAWEPDSALDPEYTVPWGTMVGHDLLGAYTHEFTVHAWDLSKATGRSDQLDPALAHAALDWFTRNVPAEDRGEGGRFAPAVPVADDVAPYTRLAAFLGRQP